MRINKQPGSGSGSGNFNIRDGGVADLNLVQTSMLDQPSGVPLSTVNNLLNPAHVDLNSVYYKVSLNGPNRVKLNVEASWKITNMNLTNPYTVSSNDGLVSIQNDTVRFTAQTVGAIQFRIDNRDFTVLCTDEIIDRPVITTVARPYTAKSVQIQASDFLPLNVVDTHDFSEWEMSYNANFDTIIEESKDIESNKTQWSLQNLQLDKTYYVRVRYKGNTLIDFSEWSVPLAVETSKRVDVSVAKPQITFPTVNANNISVRPTFSSSAFTVNNWLDTHKSSHWQVATDAAFNNVVQEAIGSETALESWTSSMLPINSILYVRVRHEGNEFGLGEWSDSIVFRTENLAVNKPSIIAPTNGATGVTFTTLLRSSTFNKVGSIDHVSSSWEVSTNASFATITKQTANDPVNKTSWTVTDLLPNTTYYARVKHFSSDGIESEWSFVNTFVTEEVRVAAPVITSPVTGNSDASIELTIQTAPFSSNYIFTHKNTDWQLSANDSFTALVASSSNDATNKTSWNPGRLNVNTTYYVRTRHRASSDLTSPWSTTTVFTTRLMAVVKPSITAPANNAQEQLFTMNATASAFQQEGNLEHAGSTWQLATNASFSSIVTSVTNDATKKTAWSVSGLLTSTDYYVRVKYHSNLGLESEWSNAITFRTMSAMVNRPTITNPAEGQQLAYGDSTLSTSGFSSVGGLAHSSTDWEIATDVNFTNVVASTGTTNTGNKQTWLVNTVV